ncbi:MAG: hypothetical protein KIT84_26140 [Labilithrix sp.]|nr:hypothetical protein [Labilithrix sp.]MCW5814536.1 hypothetical protein [Labilithrix sp.]
MDMYRDPLAGLRSQIATKRGLLELRERALPMLLRSMLPAALVKELSAKVPAAEVDPSSLEGLAGVETALDSLLAAHDEAAALAPKLRECPDEVPDPPRPATAPPWVIEEEPQLDHRAALTRRLAEIEPDAFIVRWDDWTYLSRFQLAGAPLVVRSRHVSYHRTVEHVRDSARNWARTSVPRSLPPIVVHAEGVLHTIARKLRLVRDVATGDAPFDRAYVMEGHPGAVLAIGADVRAAFVAALPTRLHLVVDRGVAEVSWRSSYEPRALLPDEVFAILLGVRAAIERA